MLRSPGIPGINRVSRTGCLCPDLAVSPPGNWLPPRLCCSAHCKQCCPEALGASHQQALCRTMKPYLYVSPLHSSVVLSVSYKTEIYSCIGVSVKDHVVLWSNIMSKASCFAMYPKCAIYLLGDLGKLTIYFCVLVSPSVKWDINALIHVDHLIHSLTASSQ